MNNIQEVEYCNLNLLFSKTQIAELLKIIAKKGFSSYFQEAKKHYYLIITKGINVIRFKFNRSDENLALIGTYNFRDKFSISLMESIIKFSKGDVEIKRFADNSIYIESLIKGELIRITKVNGLEKKILYEKNSLNIVELEEIFNNNTIEEQICILKLELDYTLMTLSDLLKAKRPSKRAITACKKELEQIRKEMISLEVYNLNKVII